MGVDRVLCILLSGAMVAGSVFAQSNDTVIHRMTRTRTYSRRDIPPRRTARGASLCLPGLVISSFENCNVCVPIESPPLCLKQFPWKPFRKRMPATRPIGRAAATLFLPH